MGHEIASLVTGLQTTTEGLAEVRAHMLGQFWASMKGMRGAWRVPLATTGAAPKPTKSDVTTDAEGLYGVLTRVELLEEARDMWEDAMQTEAARRGELAVEVDRLRVELEALRQDGVRGQLHASDELQCSIRDAIREGALSDAADAMKEVMRQEFSPVLKRVQGVEVHAHTSTVKFNQRLAILENAIVKDGGLDLIREGLTEVQQKMATIWKTVCGSEVTKGEEAVLYGLAQALLNSCKGIVKEWDDDRDRWVVETNGKNILVKAGNTFAYDGLVAKWAIIEQELRSD